MPSVQVPSDFICPITSAVMTEPVMDREGNSYEKAAIEQWLSQGNSTSPITRNPIAVSDLVINRALKNSIEQFLAQHQGQEFSVNARSSTLRAKGEESGNSTTSPSTLPPQQPPAIKFIHDDTGNYLLSLKPPAAPADVTTDSSARQPTDIVCVIDISGSMNSAATVQNEKNEVESHGLTVFNVVEHAAKTVSQLLGPKDRFALVTFNESPSTALQWTYMTNDGKKKVDTTLKGINASGRTNLWGGLQTGMDLLNSCATRSGEQRNRSILLLTDGQPNVEPPRGHIPTLKQYLDKLDPTTTAPFTVNTFGFGYSLDSALLNDIAKETGGMYTFIPDSGLVGTVFVNTVANLLVTMASNVTIGIEAPAPVKNSAQISPTNFGGFGSIGSLQYGQTRDQYFSVDFTDGKAGGVRDLKLFAKVDMLLNGEKISITAESSPMEEVEDRVLMATHLARWNFVSALTTTSRQDLKARGLHLLKSKLTANKDKHGLIAALLEDAEGQVEMALTKDEYYQKWGRHYIPSLVRANTLQQCNNFKDKSVQIYGGALFSTVRDQGEQTFLKLPPPTPRANATPLYGARRSTSTAAPRAAAPTNMNGYWNVSGGCISGDSLVKMYDGGLKKASDVVRGDVLSSGARVECRVQIPLMAGSDLVHFPEWGLSVTPYHPIQLSASSTGKAEKWTFPIDCVSSAPGGAATMTRTDEETQVFSFTLDENVSHSKQHPYVEVGGVRIVTFAHGLETDEVVAHDYFGTTKIRTDLKQLSGYSEIGVVNVTRWIRHSQTHHVVGLE